MSAIRVEDFYAFKVGAIWRYLKTESLSFWMICGYLIFEYVRPHAIYPAIDILPWAQIFIILATAGIFIEKNPKFTFGWVHFWIIFFSIVIYFSSINAHFPEVSKEKFINYYNWAVIFFLITTIINSRERFYIFLVIFILAAGKIAIGTSRNWAMRGFTFTDWGLMGPVGAFQNSGELSILMLTLFPLTYNLFIVLRKQVGKLEYIFLVVLWVAPILTILGASSRGSQMALLIQAVIMFRKYVFKPKALIAIVLLGTLAFYLLPEEQKDRWSMAGDDLTSQQRILYFEHGWEMIKEYPVLGVGYFNFAPYYEIHYPQDILFDGAQLPHNIFIQVGTDAGFLGLVPFVFMILYAFLVPYRVCKKSDIDEVSKAIIAGLALGILGFVIAGQFVTVTYYPFFWIGLSFIVSLNSILKRQSGDIKVKNEEVALTAKS